MATLKSLINEIEQLCKKELATLGFYRKRGVFIKDIDSGNLGWLGLNRATYKAEGVVDVHPVVGIINTEVEQLASTWSGSNVVRDFSPTVTEPLYFLITGGKYISWRFFQNGNTAGIVHNLREAVSDYGLPVMEKLGDKSILLEWLLGRPGKLNEAYNRYRIPAVYVLLGEKEKAREYIRSVLEQLSEDPNPYQKQWSEKYAEVMLKI